MRQIKEVLRLKFEAKLSHERIAAATGLSKGAVTRYLKRALEAGIGWPLAPQMDDAALEAQLFRSAGAPAAGHVAPDFAHTHQELKRKGVTLTLLWEEYSAAHPLTRAAPTATASSASTTGSFASRSSARCVK